MFSERPIRSTFSALRIALCCLLALSGVTSCAAKSVSVSGRVLDAATGKPIKGVRMLAYGYKNGPEAVSDADGKYELVVRPGAVTLDHRGGAPLYLRSSFEPAELTVPAEGIHGYDILLTKAEQAHGRVLSATGKPAAGAVVSIGGKWDDAKAVADASGRFTIAVPGGKPGIRRGGALGIDGGAVVLQAKEKQANGEGILTYIKREKLMRNGVTLTLAPAKSVSVSVVDRAGKPIAGAEVSMDVWVGGADEMVATKKTDGRGKTSFSGAFKGGRYGFSASCVGYDMSIGLVSANWKPTRTVVMRKADLVKGTVVDSAGNPVAGATVTQYHNSWDRTTTDARGAFKLFLAPDDKWEAGKVQFLAEDEARNLGAYACVDRTAAIAKGVKFALKPAYELQVIVKDTSDKPIAGAAVYTDDQIAYRIPPIEPPMKSTTGAEGVATLNVYEGMPTRILARMAGYTYASRPQPLPLPGSKEWTGKCEVVMTPLTRNIEGRAPGSR